MVTILIIVIPSIIFSIFCICDYIKKYHYDSWKSFISKHIIDDNPEKNEEHSIARY